MPAGLVDDQQMFVFMNDVERNLLCLKSCGLRRGLGQYTD